MIIIIIIVIIKSGGTRWSWLESALEMVKSKEFQTRNASLKINKQISILILRDVTFFSIIQKKRKNGALLFVWHDFRANIEI